jgi:hypothetical protein
MKEDAVEGRIARVEESRNAYKISFGKPEGRRLLQIPRLK